MLNFNSLMMGSSQPQVLAEFYEKVFGKPPDMAEDGWYGWQVGSCFLTIGEHSEVQGRAKEPQRLILNLETSEVEEEFTRIKELGAVVIKEPYKMSAEGEVTPDGDMQIATFADPDGNYLQLMSPWEAPDSEADKN